MELIKCCDLITGYNNKQVVKNLTFCVNSGDFLCILGENGSGKTTLMRTLLGLNRPIGGSIQFCHGLKSSEIGYLPQQTQVQRDFPASAFEVVLSGCLSSCGQAPFYSSRLKQHALHNMELLHVADLKNACYRELSGGQQQRVLLARALCASSKLILLDEPVAGLDPDAMRDMYETICSLNKQGLTVIMVSHDVDAALQYASHVLHLAHKPKFFGTVEEYKKSGLSLSLSKGGATA